MSDPLLFVDTSESNVTVTGNLHVTNHVGIGTASPGGTLDVAAQHGDITNPMVHFRANRDGASNGDGNVLKLENSGNRSDAELLQCVSSGNDRFVVKANGNVDISGNLDVGGRITSDVPYYAARQRNTASYVFDESIVYDQYVYTNYPGSFVANSATDGYYQPPMNGVYQVHMECIIVGSGNIHIQRRTGTTVNFSHDSTHYNYPHSGWMSTSADALIPITNYTTQNIRIYIDGGSGSGAWAYASYHGSAFFKWVSNV